MCGIVGYLGKKNSKIGGIGTIMDESLVIKEPGIATIFHLEANTTILPWMTRILKSVGSWKT